MITYFIFIFSSDASLIDGDGVRRPMSSMFEEDEETDPIKVFRTFSPFYRRRVFPFCPRNLFSFFYQIFVRPSLLTRAILNFYTLRWNLKKIISACRSIPLIEQQRELSTKVRLFVLSSPLLLGIFVSFAISNLYPKISGRASEKKKEDVGHSVDTALSGSIDSVASGSVAGSKLSNGNTKPGSRSKSRPGTSDSKKGEATGSISQKKVANALLKVMINEPN